MSVDDRVKPPVVVLLSPGDGGVKLLLMVLAAFTGMEEDVDARSLKVRSTDSSGTPR